MELSRLLDRLDLQTFTAFDFETTGLDPERDAVTEVAAIRFTNGERDSSFESLVNPQIPIPREITNITGISDEMVADAPKEDEVAEKLINFIGSNSIVAHNIGFDMQFLRRLSELVHPGSEVLNVQYDTLSLARAFLFFLPNHRLGTVAEFFGFSRKGEHRAGADTEKVGQIFLELVKEASSYDLSMIQKILTAIKHYELPNKELYVGLANILMQENRLGDGVLVSPIKKKSPSNVFTYGGETGSVAESAQEVFGSGGMLEETLRRIDGGIEYEERPNQIAYSEFISHVFEEGGIALAEAGTGLGKSLAYLYPSLKFALEREYEPAVISCYTKHLQDQLFYREVPKLAQSLDVSFSAVVLKGRQNYLCKTRLGWLIEDADKLLAPFEAEALIPVLIWLKWTTTGDFDECPGFLNRSTMRVKSLIQSDPGFCTRTICKQHDGCFIGPLRERVQKSDLIVINHSLLLSELTDNRVLPQMTRVVVDEAHNLVKVAYDHFQRSLSARIIADRISSVNPSSTRSKRLKGQISALAQMNPEIGQAFANLQEASEDVLSASGTLFTSLAEEHATSYRRDVHYAQKQRYSDLHDQFGAVSQEIRQLARSLREAGENGAVVFEMLSAMSEEKVTAETVTAVERVVESLNDLTAVLDAVAVTEQENWVYWEEGSFKNDDLIISLNGVSVDIGNDLNESLFRTLDSVVATSATLTVGGDFHYFLSRLGLESSEGLSVETRAFASPFFYDEQCKYYQWGGESNQKSIDFPQVLSNVIEHVTAKWRKRTMVLFTARKALEECYDELESRGYLRDHDVFAQLTSTSRGSMLKGLRESDAGLLLGTSSFWEGVDLPRDLLEVLIITKLPFDVPSEPIIEAFNERIERREMNAFMEHSVPAAAIRLRQGFGRLIRSSFDEGVFISMDNRVVKKRYGHYFQSVIPVEMKVFSSPEEL